MNRLVDLYDRTRLKHAAASAKKEGSGLEAVLNRLETEWDLLAEKLEAVAETISDETGEESS